MSDGGSIHQYTPFTIEVLRSHKGAVGPGAAEVLTYDVVTSFGWSVHGPLQGTASTDAGFFLLVEEAGRRFVTVQGVFWRDGNSYKNLGHYQAGVGREQLLSDLTKYASATCPESDGGSLHSDAGP